MARVSRKNKTVSLATEKTYKTAIYLRLSVFDSGTDSDDVIENQRSMTECFVNRQKDMRLISVYCDNGFSGTNFSRPEFERLLKDIKTNKIDCLVVKDLSRFGRNYIEVENYLQIFNSLGIRFVAITDNYDTLNNNKNDELVVPMKNIINSFVAKDISNKVSTVMKQKQQNGEFIGAFAPFGYMKNPEQKNHLIIDPVTAPIVKEIFQLKLSGYGFTKIARKLNERNIASPLLYNYLSGRYKIKLKPTGNKAIWNSTMIKQIIENYTYTGNLTQGKRVKSLASGIKTSDLEKSQHIIVNNTHEAIISEEIFKELEMRNAKTSEKYREERCKHPSFENKYKSKVVCADCGTKMIRIKNVGKDGKISYNHICRLYKQNLNAGICTKKNVRETSLEEIILLSLNSQIKLLTDLNKKIEDYKNTDEYKSIIQENNIQLSKYQDLLDQNLHKQSKLFEIYADGMMDLEEYNSMKSVYIKDAQELDTKKLELENRGEQENEILSAQNQWIKSFIEQKNTEVLTVNFIDSMIDKIVVSGYNDIEIIWKYSDCFSLLRCYDEK